METLKTENSRLQSVLREAERKTRGLRETVASLLEPAARGFPGEEPSTKKPFERPEMDRRGNRPLASAIVTIQVVIGPLFDSTTTSAESSIFRLTSKLIDGVS